MKTNQAVVAAVLVTLALSACATPPGAGERVEGGPVGQPQPARTLIAVLRVEPATVAAKALQEGGVALHLSKRMFNAELAVLDDHGRPQPYLAEELPRLGSPSWSLFPDGTMETVYRLRPGIVWHDSTPLSAEDFVFAWRVYATPELGHAASPPLSLMEEVSAPNAQTVRIRWRRSYPQAGAIEDDDFPSLPRHILGPSFESQQLDALQNHPFWSREYVGLGPYRLDRWEPGAFIEAAAFDRHILGRPKIERVKLIFNSDANAALATLLAGEAQLSADTSLRLEQVATLKQEWGPRQAGSVLLHLREWRATYFQFRPEYAAPAAILDARVRRALAHAVDKQAMDATLYGSAGLTSEFMISPRSEVGALVDREIVKYPYDLRASEELMNQAGFTRTGGLYASPGGRLTIELKTNAAADNEAEMAIIASGWRQAGFDVQEIVLPAAQAQDNQVRSTFPGIYINNVPGGEAALGRNTTAEIPRADNRWRGANRGGWSNADYDPLADAFASTLDRDERVRQAIEMAKIYTREVPAIPLFFRAQPWAHIASLQGLRIAAPESNMAWNVHEWELR